MISSFSVTHSRALAILSLGISVAFDRHTAHERQPTVLEKSRFQGVAEQSVESSDPQGVYRILRRSKVCITREQDADPNKRNRKLLKRLHQTDANRVVPDTGAFVYILLVPCHVRVPNVCTCSKSLRRR